MHNVAQHNAIDSIPVIWYDTKHDNVLHSNTILHNVFKILSWFVTMDDSLSCSTSLIRVHVYASMQRFRDFEEANPLSLPSTPSGTSLRLESALVQRRLKASPRWHSKGWFFCFLEGNSNFWSPQHDWKTKIIWNWSPTYSNSHDLSRFSALPVT